MIAGLLRLVEPAKALITQIERFGSPSVMKPLTIAVATFERISAQVDAATRLLDRARAATDQIGKSLSTIVAVVNAAGVVLRGLRAVVSRANRARTPGN